VGLLVGPPSPLQLSDVEIRVPPTGSGDETQIATVTGLDDVLRGEKRPLCWYIRETADTMPTLRIRQPAPEMIILARASPAGHSPPALTQQQTLTLS